MNDWLINLRKFYFYEPIWMFGAWLESVGGRLGRWGYFHYFPQHPDNPYRKQEQ